MIKIEDPLGTPNKDEFLTIAALINDEHDYLKRLEMFSRYYDLSNEHMNAVFRHFNFPFPIPMHHTDNELNSIEKTLEYTNSSFKGSLSIEMAGVTLSVVPKESWEWRILNHFIINNYFPTHETLTDRFNNKLQSAPEPILFVEKQIEKIQGIIKTGRRDVIPFHLEYYEIDGQSNKPYPIIYSWYDNYSFAFKLAREESSFINLSKEIRLTDLYFYNLGFSYAHYLGYLKETLPLIKEGKFDGLKESSPAPSKIKEITLARQVLAVHYLLNKSGINPIDNPTATAKFLQFLTGRELNAKRIQDTTLYKTVRSPFKLKDAELLKDLLFILPLFEDLKLPEITEGIRNEIKICTESG